MKRAKTMLIALVLCWGCGGDTNRSLPTDQARLGDPASDGEAPLRTPVPTPEGVPPGADGEDPDLPSIPLDPSDPLVTLSVDSTTVGAGESAQVCVSMASPDQEVAGVENELLWDNGCVSLEACEASPEHGKELYSAIRESGLKALVLSLKDSNAMPEGTVYCCSFQTNLDVGACCPVTIYAVGSGDPDGNALDTVGVSGEICRD